MKKQIGYIVILIAAFVMHSCAGDDGNDDQPVVRTVVPAQLTSPFNEGKYSLGQPVPVGIKVNDPSRITKMELYVNDTLYKGDLTIENQTITIQTNGKNKVGKIPLYLKYTDTEGKQKTDNRTIIFFSDVAPGNLTAEIVKDFPHDKASYTQGLEFYKGKLFEGTGQYSHSVLAEVDLNSGTRLREYKLLDANFGEGITILNDTIYQITYRAEKCYIYDMNFNLLGSNPYEGEGWGLCNDGRYLIMTNGSSEIVWREPKTFKIVKTISVFDHQMSVGNLNELELMNGNLFMNLYTEDRIAEVDTSTGKVINYIDCSALVAAAADPGNDVLNGIAQNPLTGKIYMTGKLWPKLFEVNFK